MDRFEYDLYDEVGDVAVGQVFQAPPTLTFFDFRHELYDWEEWKRRTPEERGHRIAIRLTQGYFVLASESRSKMLTVFPDGSPQRWHAGVKRSPSGELLMVYAVRWGRRCYGEPKTVCMHRLITGTLHSRSLVDHVNGNGLDNSDLNLEVTTASINNHNALRTRQNGVQLLRGVVELRRKDGVKYQGQVCRRHGKDRKVTTLRSPLFDRQIDAHCWYLETIGEVASNRNRWAFAPKSVTYPILPERLESEPRVRCVRQDTIARTPSVPVRKLPAIFPSTMVTGEDCPF